MTGARGHEIGHRVGGAADDLQLARDRAPALGQIVLVDKARPEALELGMVPEDVGLLVEVDAAGEPLLQDQRLPDLLEKCRLRAARQVPLAQGLRDRVDALEGGGDAALVVGKRHAHGERLGDE